MLAGLAPCNQAIGFFLKAPGWQSWLEKFSKKVIRQIHSNVKIHLTKFDRTNLAFALFDNVGSCKMVYSTGLRYNWGNLTFLNFLTKNGIP